MAKLKKVILPQGREHKAAGLYWVLGAGCWDVNPKNPINLKNPTNSKKAAGLPELYELMASSAFDILEGNEIVTWTNTIIGYSRRIQKAEKGKLPARAGCETMDQLNC